MIKQIIEATNGLKFATSCVLAVIYAIGLLFHWWEREYAFEGFIGFLFTVGGGHKIVKRRKRKRETEVSYRDDPHSDNPRRYDSVEDLLNDRED